MSFSKRISSVVLIACMLVVTVLFGNMKEENYGEAIFGGDDTLVLWYTDDSLTDYLNSIVYSYQEEHDIKVTPVLVSGLEYLETINQASLDDKGAPDLFIISNDCVEKAYLAGLASEIKPKDDTISENAYPKTALQAVTYMDKMVAYPFYYETTVLLYNKTYMEEFAKTTIENNQNIAEGEAAMEEIESADSQEEAVAQAVSGNEVSGNQVSEEAEVTQEQIEATANVSIPKTIDDILAFAEVYEAPETVESVFKWDVSDIFYNYFFVGNYINVGGENGDHSDQIDIYNTDTISCLKVYQAMNQFFSIDTKAVSYEDIVQEFIAGKTVFTVVTTDAIVKMEEAKADGTFQFEYGVTRLPDVSDQLASKSLSVTNAVAINGYSNNSEKANAFAQELTGNVDESLFLRTGKISCKKGIVYQNEYIDETMSAYENSVPVPKMLETTNFWVQLEIGFTKIWTGSDVNETLRALSEQVKTQVSGQPVTEEVIPDPVVEAVEEDLAN